MEGEQWRAFKHDTEAGRLLARLYGVEANSGRPQINYPKLKTKKDGGALKHDSKWRAVGAPSISDPKEKRYDRGKAANVPVPRFGRTKPKRAAAVDDIPKRKPAVSCLQEVDTGRQNQKAYRPPRQNAVYSETEKEKLNEIFTYKGGVALPTELTHPIALMPSEVKRRVQEEGRVKQARDRRRFRMYGACDIVDDEADNLLGDNKPKSSNEILFDQIFDEIMDRRSWQLQMEECSAGGPTRQKIADEMSARAKELFRLDKEKAKKALDDLN